MFDIFPENNPKPKTTRSRRPENLEEYPFDLIEAQTFVRNSLKPKDLYEWFETICKKYDKGQITKYQIDEITEVVQEQMKVLEAIKKQLDP